MLIIFHIFVSYTNTLKIFVGILKSLFNFSLFIIFNCDFTKSDSNSFSYVIYPKSMVVKYLILGLMYSTKFKNGEFFLLSGYSVNIKNIEPPGVKSDLANSRASLLLGINMKDDEKTTESNFPSFFSDTS